MKRKKKDKNKLSQGAAFRNSAPRCRMCTGSTTEDIILFIHFQDLQL